MQDKSDLVLNQLATNTGIKIGQLEGEKAILQVELKEVQAQNQELSRQLEELRKEDN